MQLLKKTYCISWDGMTLQGFICSLLQRFPRIYCLGSMQVNTISILETVLTPAIFPLASVRQFPEGLVASRVRGVLLDEAEFQQSCRKTISPGELLVPWVKSAPHSHFLSFQILSQCHFFHKISHLYSLNHCIRFLRTSGFVGGMETRDGNKKTFFIFERRS